MLAAYTATFGNGFTATISLEDQQMRRGGIWDASNDATNALTIGAFPGPGSVVDSYNVTAVTFGDSAGTGIPDIVGSLRVDQAWGSAQIAGALHQLRAGYFGNNTTGVFIAVGSRNESRGLTFDHHHPRFDVDEKSLALGAEVLLETTRRYLAS